MIKLLGFIVLLALSSCALDNMGNYSGARPTTIIGYLTTDGTPLADTTDEDYVILTYMFVIEDQKTMGVCVKPSKADLATALADLPISIEVSSTFVDATAGAPHDSIPVSTTSGNMNAMAITSTVCPYDGSSYFVAYLDMDALTSIQYVTIYVANAGKMSIGSAMTPFYAEESLNSGN